MALEKHPAAAKAFASGGHEVCSHGYKWINHDPDLSSPESVVREKVLIKKGITAIQETTGLPPRGWYFGRSTLSCQTWVRCWLILVANWSTRLVEQVFEEEGLVRPFKRSPSSVLRPAEATTLLERLVQRRATLLRRQSREHARQEDPQSSVQLGH
jgi:peptidoglycan/xylan/chitin deacetylase (PgdA/CDA1 family)